MKRHFTLLLLFVAGLLTAFAVAREAQWKKVDQAINEGLPKTAIEALEPIIKDAIAEKRHGEALKAIA
ncbi:MAG: hypothetical protein ACK4UN_10485, partial [Limisphaerales bacterium]